MKRLPNKINYKIIVIVFVLSCLFCGWPDFHPEEYLGLSYHWALDMLFHSSYYFVITLVLCWLFFQHIKPLFLYTLLLSFSFVLEVVQLGIPGRTFTLLDLTSNLLGITTGFLLFIFFGYLKSLQNKKEL
ncbi:MAG TPA: hypothetical protein VNW06_05755 [Cytophagaceae bacterium]|jgi:VanZ family protein|nr:hypothetical protein [Cytophagaceae bacterium]